MASVNGTRIEPLDALRGFAALGVLLIHLWWISSTTVFAIPNAIVHGIKFGETGVILFFVISGFSLDLTMPKHLKSETPLTSYFLSRFFRIAPLYYAVLVFTVVRDSVAHTPANYHGATELLDLSFLFNFFPHQQLGIVWAGWTISVEMIFYLLFPIIFSTPLLPWLAGSLALYALVVRLNPGATFGDYQFMSFAGFVPVFMLGMITHRAYRRFQNSSRVSGQVLALVSVAALLGIALFYNDATSFYFRLPLAVAYSGLVLGSILWEPKWLCSPVTGVLGALSYGIYLLQFPVLLALKPFYEHVFARIAGVGAYTVAIPTTFAVMIAICWPVYRYFEKPCDDYRRTLVSAIADWRKARGLSQISSRS